MRRRGVGGWRCAGGAGRGGPSRVVWPTAPVNHFQLPGAVGDVDVVFGVDEDEVVDVGVAAVGPGGDVVDLAQGAGGRAAGDDAADVAGVQGGLLGGGGQAVAAAQVQDGAVLVQDDAASVSAPPRLPHPRSERYDPPPTNTPGKKQATARPRKPDRE